MGAELQARYLDASASGAAELAERWRGVADGCWPWVACGCRAYRGGGAFHIDRHHAHEPQALGTRPRSRFRRDAHAAGALGHLHAVRTTLSVLATLLYIWLLLGA